MDKNYIEKNSFAKDCVNIISRDNKGKTFTIRLLIVCFLISNIFWGWLYVNVEYELVTETTTVETTDDSNAIINKGGEVNVGKDNSQENNSKEE